MKIYLSQSLESPRVSRSWRGGGTMMFFIYAARTYGLKTYCLLGALQGARDRAVRETQVPPCGLVRQPFLLFVQVRVVNIAYLGSAHGVVFIHFRAEEKTQCLPLCPFTQLPVVSHGCLTIISRSNSSNRAHGLCPPPS